MGGESAGNDRMILQAIGTPLLCTDMDGVVTYWNEPCEDLFGWSAAEVIGRPVRSVLAHDAQSPEGDLIRASILAGNPWSGEWVVHDRAGRAVPLRLHDTPLRGEDGSVIGIVAVATPIAEEVEARRALQASERRFRALTERASDGVAVLDAANVVTYVSQSLLDLMGASPQDIVGHPASDFIAVDDDGEPESVDILGPSDEAGPVDFRVRTLNGGIVYFEGVRSDLLDDPDIAGVVWNLRDVTGTRDAQIALAHSEERLRALAAGSSEATIVIDAGERVRYVSDSFERVLGHRGTELMNMSMRDLSVLMIHPDDLGRIAAVRGGVFRRPGSSAVARTRLRHLTGRGAGPRPGTSTCSTTRPLPGSS